MVAVRTLLARAYQDDPLLAWLFPDPATRLDANAAFLGLFAEHYQAVDRVATVHEGNELAAVALFRMPDDPPWQQGLPSVAGLMRLLMGADRTAAAADQLHRIAEITPSAPHAYLNILAVEPSMQGRNLGARALDGVVRLAGSRGLGVHLETANPRNHTFYARAGFVAGDELTLGAGGPTLRAMYRPVSR